MAKLSVVRTNQSFPPVTSLEHVKAFLFKCFRGANADEDKAWRKFWSRLVHLEPGEFAFLEHIFPRNPLFHRKFFALLDVGFDLWEPDRVRKSYKGMPMEKNRDQFREDVTIRAGFYVQTFDLDGKMTLRAKSIKFAKMDDVEFERLYQAVIDVLLKDVCSHYKDRAELDALVDQVLRFAT